jgi:hypothetical protein
MNSQKEKRWRRFCDNKSLSLHQRLIRNDGVMSLDDCFEDVFKREDP